MWQQDTDHLPLGTSVARARHLRRKLRRELGQLLLDGLAVLLVLLWLSFLAIAACLPIGWAAHAGMKVRSFRRNLRGREAVAVDSALAHPGRNLNMYKFGYETTTKRSYSWPHQLG